MNYCGIDIASVSSYVYVTDARGCKLWSGPVETTKTVVNPTKVKLIAESRRKTDKIDAKILCELLRLDALPCPVHKAIVPSPLCSLRLRTLVSPFPSDEFIGKHR